MFLILPNNQLFNKQDNNKLLPLACDVKFRLKHVLIVIFFFVLQLHVIDCKLGTVYLRPHCNQLNVSIIRKL